MKQREVNFSSLVFILTSPPADALHRSHGLFRPPWLPVALSALQEWGSLDYVEFGEYLPDSLFPSVKNRLGAYF